MKLAGIAPQKMSEDESDVETSDSLAVNICY
jgi:hypothetical protein